MSDGAKKSEEEWADVLTVEQYSVLREGATEPAYSGEYWSCTRPGVYGCAGCGQALFASNDKMSALYGWPCFARAIDENAIRTQSDWSHGMARTEVCCARCGGHLGHVFDDDPEPGRRRFSINSVALRLVESGQ